MLANDIFARLQKAAKVVSKIVIDTTSFGGSRTRYDDNIGGNITDDLATMLRTNPDFKKWYIDLQRRESEESDINRKRELELKLMYPFKYYSDTLTGKAKSDWEGSRNTYRDSDQNQSRTGDGEEDDSHYADGAARATDNYISDEQRYELFHKYTSKSNSFKYTLESTGKYATGHEQDPADNVMTSQFLTKLIREVNKHRDPKVMTLLMGMLLRWGVNVPTYVNRRDVPKEWWRMVQYANKNGGIAKATTNMRTFLDEFGLKRFGSSTPQLRELRSIILRITDSDTVEELFSTLTSPQAGQRNDGHMGRAKDYFDINVTAKQMNMMKDLNESFDQDHLLQAVLLNCIYESLPVQVERDIMQCLVLKGLSYEQL